MGLYDILRPTSQGQAKRRGGDSKSLPEQRILGKEVSQPEDETEQTASSPLTRVKKTAEALGKNCSYFLFYFNVL